MSSRKSSSKSSSSKHSSSRQSSSNQPYEGPATLLTGHQYEEAASGSSAGHGPNDTVHGTTGYIFQVPLDYRDPSDHTLFLVANLVSRRASYYLGMPVMVYLCGGPGSDNPATAVPSIVDFLTYNFQVLFVNYRGCGDNSKIDKKLLKEMGGPKDQAKSLKLLTQNNIVRDLHAIRQCLSLEWYGNTNMKWNLFGQSFGGWIIGTYLSNAAFSQGVDRAYMTAGLFPLGRSADEVYTETYTLVLKRNEEYYRTFPEDIKRVQDIVFYLHKQKKIEIPKVHNVRSSGGFLTAQRFLGLGRNFGAAGGYDKVHNIVADMHNAIWDVAQEYWEEWHALRNGSKSKSSKSKSSKGGASNKSQRLSPELLQRLRTQIQFDKRPLYAVMHEAIYYNGKPTRWAAQRVGLNNTFGRHYFWLDKHGLEDYFERATVDDVKQPFAFSGEMVYPFQFDVYDGLDGFKDAASLLAEAKDIEPLYDHAQLQNNTVPLRAMLFENDMYVARTYAEQTGGWIGNTEVLRSNFEHGAVKDAATSSQILSQLIVTPVQTA